MAGFWVQLEAQRQQDLLAEQMQTVGEKVLLPQQSWARPQEEQQRSKISTVVLEVFISSGLIAKKTMKIQFQNEHQPISIKAMTRHYFEKYSTTKMKLMKDHYQLWHLLIQKVKRGQKEVFIPL